LNFRISRGPSLYIPADSTTKTMGKRKHSDSEVSNAVAGLATDSLPAKQRKKIKKDRVAADVGQHDAAGTDLSKAERKALKKAQRREAKIEAELEKSVGTMTAAGKERRREKKAQKAQKALRKAERLKAAAAYTSDSEESTQQIPSLQSSLVPSEDQSSATSPEPTDDGSGGSGSSYRQNQKLSILPQATVDSFLSSNDIQIKDPQGSESRNRPITSFEYLPALSQISKSAFSTFSAPTPIQAAAWPYLFGNRDVIGIAETGSGKTLAFGVPCIRRISSLPKDGQKGVKAVIVSPTRELAVQIHEQLVKVASPAGLNVVCVYGGVPKDEQRLLLKKAHIIVATPGRLNDLLSEGATSLGRAEFVCLDEADRMLDKGFEEGMLSV
jgi:ATP-dependent RNA helicase DBP3